MPLIEVPVAFLCTMVFAIIIGFISKYHAIDATRDEAAKHGAGIWRVNPKTGEKRWVWLNYEQATGWVDDMNRGARKPVDVSEMMHDELGRK
jgi:hypothetical protein